MTRALRATVAAGIGVQRIEIDPAGKIVVVIGKPQAACAVDDLDRELTAFEERNGQG